METGGIRDYARPMTEKRRLLARCPQTGFWLVTGVEVTEEVLEYMGTIQSQVFCPQCATIHTWTRREAALEAPSNGRRHPLHPEARPALES